MDLDITERIAVTGGYTPAIRFRARLADGRTVFVKQAVDVSTAAWLQTEARAYTDLRLPCMATLVGSGTFEGRTTIVLEDLGHARWPPPWQPGDIERVVQTLAEIAATPAPAWVQPLDRHVLTGWHQVAADPDVLLRLGLCGVGWLERALPTLLEAEDDWPEGPPVLAHFDLRSDNLCLLHDRVVVVDWNHVCLAPPGMDLAFWGPSLAAEGGWPPERVVGHAPTWAARVSGFFAARAGQPEIPTAPRVRWIQRVQLAEALPWAARALDLPPPE